MDLDWFEILRFHFEVCWISLPVLVFILSSLYCFMGIKLLFWAKLIWFKSQSFWVILNGFGSIFNRPGCVYESKFSFWVVLDRFGGLSFHY